MAQSKEERAQQMMKTVGGNKKKQGKKPKKEQVEYEDAFNFDIITIQKFGLLRVSPPIGPEELDAKIEVIQKRRVEFEAEGEQKLKEAVAELNRQANEHDAEEAKEIADQPTERVEYRGGRGGRGRGGRGRGGNERGERDETDTRGGYRGGRDGTSGRGGRGGKDKFEFRVKSEFEGEEEEEFQPMQPAKKRPQKKEDL